MNERSLSVTEAARHFSDLVNRTWYRGETTLLMRSGEAVAKVAPVGGGVVTGRDWVAKWRKAPHLSAKDAEEFAIAVKSSRARLSAPARRWD